MKCSGVNCDKTPRWNITYDCGKDIQKLILCDYHYTKDSVFQEEIQEIEELK